MSRDMRAVAAAADSAAVDKLFEGGLLLIWSYAHRGVLSKYRNEFPICTFSLAKDMTMSHTSFSSGGVRN